MSRCKLEVAAVGQLHNLKKGLARKNISTQKVSPIIDEKKSDTLNYFVEQIASIEKLKAGFKFPPGASLDLFKQKK